MIIIYLQYMFPTFSMEGTNHLYEVEERAPLETVMVNVIILFLRRQSLKGT